MKIHCPLDLWKEALPDSAGAVADTLVLPARGQQSEETLADMPGAGEFQLCLLPAAMVLHVLDGW